MLAKKKAKRKPAPPALLKSIERGASKLAQQLEGMFSPTPSEITAAIKADHEALRNYLGILKDTDRDMIDAQGRVRRFFGPVEIAHDRRENALYKPTHKLPGHAMQHQGGPRVRRARASDDLMKRIDRERNALTWSAHANVLSEIVEHHLKEEERDLCRW